MKSGMQEIAGEHAVRTGGAAATRVHTRREIAWAWLSLITLILCWDASERLDAKVSPPRVRIAHAGERDDHTRAGAEIPNLY